VLFSQMILDRGLHQDLVIVILMALNGLNDPMVLDRGLHQHLVMVFLMALDGDTKYPMVLMAK